MGQVVPGLKCLALSFLAGSNQLLSLPNVSLEQAPCEARERVEVILQGWLALRVLGLARRQSRGCPIRIRVVRVSSMGRCLCRLSPVYKKDSPQPLTRRIHHNRYQALDWMHQQVYLNPYPNQLIPQDHVQVQALSTANCRDSHSCAPLQNDRD
jgi:hypothetical protein